MSLANVEKGTWIPPLTTDLNAFHSHYYKKTDCGSLQLLDFRQPWKL